MLKTFMIVKNEHINSMWMLTYNVYIRNLFSNTSNDRLFKVPFSEEK